MGDYENWCRLCAQDNGSDILINGSEENCRILKKQINKYLGLTILPDDNSPQSVCKNCFSKLKYFDTFATQCSYVQNLFHALLTRPAPLDQNQVSLLKNEFNVCADEVNSSELDYKDPALLHEDQSQNPSAIQQQSNEIESTSQNRRSSRNKSQTERGNFEVVMVKQEDSDDDQLLRDDSPLQDAPQPKRKRGRPKGSSPRGNNTPKKRRSKIKREISSDSEGDDDFLNSNDNDISDPDSDFKLENDIENGKLKEDKLEKEKKEKEKEFFFKWECYVCDETFRTYGILNRHCRDAHDSNPKITCICGKILCTRASLRRHKMLHSNNYIKCTQCCKVFTKESYLTIHMKSHLPKEELPFVCYHCGARYATESRLRRHEVAHIPSEERQIHPCPHCDKRFMKPQAVDVHIKSVHLQEKPFVCHECGRAFSSKGTLNEHLLIHSDEAPYVCHCGKRFKTVHRLKLHTDTHRETRYQCPVCPLELNTRRTLRQHLVIHKDHRAYQCAVCHKGFKRYKGLKTHEILHSGRRPYSCPFCDRTFTNGSNCRSHKRRMHPEELAAYEAALAIQNAAALQQSVNAANSNLPNTFPPAEPVAAPPVS